MRRIFEGGTGMPMDSMSASISIRSDGCQRGQELILDICSIRGGITKLGRSAKDPLALLEWELFLKPKPEERREDRQS